MVELPIENVLAAFPRSERIGGIVLRPLTLGGVIAFDALGIDVLKPVGSDKALLAAAVLSGHVREVVAGEFDFGSFAKAFKDGLYALAKAVNAIVDASFVTYVAPQPQVGRTGGNGWALDYVEMMMRLYGMTFDGALDTPLARVFALAAVYRSASGVDHGAPDYVERTKIAAMRAAEDRNHG
mgnify:CR=1 FL=1